ncbi:MAG: sensor histidine kinase [Planctomycetota bacterium]|jgi:signal transduction histidine kinase
MVSVRWKFVIVLYAAITLVAALFLVLHVYARGMDVATINLSWAGTMVMVMPVIVIATYRAFVAKPLQRILEGAESLAKGDHSHRIDLIGDDELAAVAASTNRMAEWVAESTRDLERQVAERTEDLRAVLEEVHERSRIAEEVNRRLADSDRRKTDFLTNVSHELRTPLNSIMGFLRLLQDGLYENEEERHEFLANARRSADHLLYMVTEVLSAARLEEGELDIKLEMVHPGDVICDVLGLLDVQIREKQLSTRLEVDGKLLVLSDEARLKQVLINLVGNAVKFTDSGEVIIRVNPDGSRVRFEVEDTGEGLPEEELEKVFRKFHQVDSSSVRHHGGTGLGLAIARELVRMMGGEIGAKSEGPGKGSLFHFDLAGVKEVPQKREYHRIP